MSEVPWGEMPYDNRKVADVVYDYAVIRGDLVEQYARDQLSTWIERLVRQRQAEAWEQGARACDISWGYVDQSNWTEPDETPNPYRTTRGEQTAANEGEGVGRG